MTHDLQVDAKRAGFLVLTSIPWPRGALPAYGDLRIYHERIGKALASSLFPVAESVKFLVTRPRFFKGKGFNEAITEPPLH